MMVLVPSILTIFLVVTLVGARLELSPDHSFKYCIGPNCLHNTIVSDEPMGCQPHSERIDPTDCQHYFVCKNGRDWERQLCPPGQAWHPHFQFCTRQEYVKCETRCGMDGKFRDPYDCRKFYVCIFRAAFTFGCGSGTIFDETSGQCIEGNTC